MKRFDHILVPIDFGQPAEWAVFLAARLDATVTLLHVCPLPARDADDGAFWPMAELMRDARERLRAIGARLRTRWPRVRALVAAGTALEQIVATVVNHDVDLVVIGASDPLLADVAQKLVRACPVQVLVVGAAPPEVTRPQLASSAA